MDNTNKLNQLLFSGPENSNKNQNFNNININILNNSNFYNNNKDKFVKAEISNIHDISFCTKEDKGCKSDFILHHNSENYDIYNQTTSMNDKIFDEANKNQEYNNLKVSNMNNTHTDVNIKNKIMNLNNSLKSLNIQIKNSKLINYSDYENCRNKNNFINHLLDYIIDIVWLLKDERILKNEFMQKINAYNVQAEEYERKVKKLTAELTDTKKYLRNALHKGEVPSNKNTMNYMNNKNSGLNNVNDKSFDNGDLAALKANNKKLSSQISILKNDNKKRELEYNKLQERLKKLLSEKIGNSGSQSFEKGNHALNNNNYNNSVNSIHTFNPTGNKTFIVNDINNKNNINNMHTNTSYINNRSIVSNNNDIFKLSSLLNANNEFNLKLENSNILNSFNTNYNNINSNTSSRKHGNYSNNTNTLQKKVHSGDSQLKLLYKKFLEFNTDSNLVKKYNSLINQNSCLMKVLFNFQESLEKINQKIIYFNKNNTKIKIELLELIKLKEHIFSLHLIDKELLSEFTDNFIENIRLLEEVILKIMEVIFLENSQIKEKYFKLEKDFLKIKGNNNNIISHTLENEIYTSRDSNNLNLNFHNTIDNNISMSNSNNNNKSLNKDKDLIKNLKRWNANKVGFSLKNSSSSRYSEKNLLRNSSFVFKAFDYSNNYEDKINHYPINSHNTSYSVNKNKY